MADSRLAPEVAYRVAADHQETAGNISSQQKAFDDAVAGLRADGSGEMIKALDAAGAQWSSELRAIIQDLQEMAEKVTSAVGAISSTDSTNADGIGKVALDILRDI